jgi:hypothetical protein
VALKQTRKSVSLSAAAFEHAAAAAKTAGMSLSKFTEMALTGMIQATGRAVRSADAPAFATICEAPEVRVLIQTDIARTHGLPDDVEHPKDLQPIADLIARSSVGRGLANIAANGIDAELADLDEELAQVSDEQMAAVLGPPEPTAFAYTQGMDDEPEPDDVRVEYEE